MRSRYLAFLTLSVAWFLALGLFAGPIASMIGIFHPILFVTSAIGFAVIAGQFG